jgi:hypothetical protein
MEMEMYNPSHESALIITHKHQFIQPDLLEFPKKKQIGTDSHITIHNSSSEIQSTAFSLYDIGLNPFPLPLGKKGGYPWKQLQYTRLDKNHEQSGLFMLFSGKCNLAIMCGRTSRNLFVIDCESQQALKFHISQMRKRNIPLWVSETQRGGHIYMFSADGEINNIPTGTLIDAEIKGSKGYILAPPSIHPSGKQYTWLIQDDNEPPTVSIQEINWLRDAYGNPVNLEAYQPKSMNDITVSNKQPYQPLSRRTRNYIHNGHTVSEGSRNNELFSASCDMVGNNYTKQETLITLSPPAQASGLSLNEITTTIKSAFSQPRTPAKPNSSQYSKTPDWHWVALYADNHKWSGRTATSQRAIFTALIHRAKVSYNEEGLFRASIREIATLSRTGTATVQRILKEFQNPHKPYIIKCGYDKLSRATLWKFPTTIIRESQELNLDTLKESPQWLSCSVSNLTLPDCIERNGLGYNGLLLYRMMSDQEEPIMPKMIEELTDLTLSQVKYSLKKLEFFELIYRMDEGWVAYIYNDEELDKKVNEKKSIIGKGEQRKRRFARERAIYAGRQLFNARLRYERSVFKTHVVDTLRLIHSTKYDESLVDLPVYTKMTYQENKKKQAVYRRVALSELEEDDLSWCKLGLALGAEVIIQDFETG